MGWAESTYSSHFSPSSESGKIRLLFKHVLGRLMKLSEFLTAVWLKIQVFWDVPLSLGDQFPMCWTTGTCSPTDTVSLSETWIFRINIFCSFTLIIFLECRVKFEILAVVTVKNTFSMWHDVAWLKFSELLEECVFLFRTETYSKGGGCWFSETLVSFCKTT